MHQNMGDCTAQMNEYPFVSIVIPTKNEAALLPQCLKSIKQLSYPRDRVEIIIADGLSTDDTVKIAQAYGAKVVTNPKQTEAPGRNVGFSASKGKLIAFSDADCIMNPYWLENAVKFFEDESVGGVGGPTFLPQEQNSFAIAVGFIFQLAVKIAGSAHTPKRGKIREVKHITTCNAIYRREALEKVMPIDENLLSEDLEISRLIIQQGYHLLFVPDVCVWHYKRASPSKFWRQMYRFAIGRLQIGKKDFRWLHPLHILVGLMGPLLFIALIVSFIAILPLAQLITGLIFTTFVLLFCAAAVQTRSMKIAIHVPLALIILIVAWSYGFLKELFFPRQPQQFI